MQKQGVQPQAHAVPSGWPFGIATTVSIIFSFLIQNDHWEGSDTKLYIIGAVVYAVTALITAFEIHAVFYDYSRGARVWMVISSAFYMFWLCQCIHSLYVVIG